MEINRNNTIIVIFDQYFSNEFFLHIELSLIVFIILLALSILIVILDFPGQLFFCQKKCLRIYLLRQSLICLLFILLITQNK